MLIVISLIVVAGQQLVAGQSGPIVDTTYGQVQGFNSMDHMNRTYDGFLGIPFAQPPLDQLRWARPVVPDPWTGVRNSTWWRPHCIQFLGAVYPLAGFSGNESEDCLYLNVYVPVNLDDALLNPRAVMFFIFGGAYQFGTAEMYPGDTLATGGDVVVVNFNYRTGMMGFMSSGDAVAAGNWGLWDTKAALQWVIDNIASFGGDPQRITIIGQSAGGSSVMHAMHSLQTNTMFQGGISISGGGRAMSTDNETVLYIGSVHGCDTTDTQLTVDCLRQIPGKELVQNMSRQGPLDGLVPVYGVFIDDFANPGESFIDQDTDLSWEQGRGSHIDFIGGTTIHDYAGFALGKILGIEDPRETNDYNRPNTYWFTYWMTRFSFYENTVELVDTLYERFPDMNSTDDAVASEQSVRVITDMMFGAAAYYQNEERTEFLGTGSTYHYIFKHRQSFLGGFPQWCEGSHLDDLYSILGEAFMRYVRERLMGDFNADDKSMSNTLMKYYSNFATTGDPNVGPHVVDVLWPRYDSTTRQFMVESVTPVIAAHTQELQDHFNWILYDFPAMMIPASGDEEMGGGEDVMPSDFLRELSEGFYQS